MTFTKCGDKRNGINSGIDESLVPAPNAKLKSIPEQTKSCGYLFGRKNFIRSGETLTEHDGIFLIYQNVGQMTIANPERPVSNVHGSQAGNEICAQQEKTFRRDAQLDQSKFYDILR